MKLIAKKVLPNGNEMVRYDLHIKDTHNFVANGVVVHNTNCRCGKVLGLDGMELMAGSMEVRRKMPENNWENNTYWFPFTIPEVRKMIEENGNQSKNFIVFGEVYGPNVQKGYHYDVKSNLGFKVFDILVDGMFFDHDEMKGMCEKYGVEIAPVLYRGPYSIDKIKEIADGETTVGSGHIREGVVVRPVKERNHPSVGRLVMKYVGSEYLLSKHPDVKDV